MKKNGKYRRLRASVEAYIVTKLGERKALLGQDAESLFLFLDTIVCPFLGDSAKRQLFRLYGISNATDQDAIMRKRKYWFIKWTDFNIQTELDIKLGQEVY